MVHVLISHKMTIKGELLWIETLEKKVLLAGLLILLILFTAACSNSDSDAGSTDKENDPKKAKNNELTITFRSGGSTNQGLINWLNDMVIPKFNEENPEVNVQLSPLEVSEGDYFAKVALLLQSEDTAPDIVTEDTFMVNSDASAGYLEALDDRMESWDGWDKVTDTVKKKVL